MVPSRKSNRVRIEGTKYEPDENLRDRSESKVARDNGIRTAARRRLVAKAREEAEEAKRRRLTLANGFHAQRSEPSSKAQLQMRNYEEEWSATGRSTSRLTAAVPGSLGVVDVAVALPAPSQPLPHKSRCLQRRR